MTSNCHTAAELAAGPTADVAVIILSYNEEANIAQAVESVAGWARQIVVLDSFSTDRTLEIANRYPCEIHQRAFDDYATQRNYALDALPIKTTWVFFLDADEWLPTELKSEIAALISRDPAENGFYVKRKMIWMGRWIRRGYYPIWILRLFRRGRARVEQRAVNEHVMVDGATGRLDGHFMHQDRKTIDDWIAKHNRYATGEARELCELEKLAREIDVSFWGSQPARKRWLRNRVWNRMPPLVRPFFYFLYRYVLCGGFLDGREAFIYHFLQALWFPFLIDVKYLEMTRERARPR